MLFSQHEALKPRDDTVKKDYRKTRREKGGEKKKRRGFMKQKPKIRLLDG